MCILIRTTLPEIISLPLKMDGWNTLSYWGGLFSGAMLVSARGGYVDFVYFIGRKAMKDWSGSPTRCCQLTTCEDRDSFHFICSYWTYDAYQPNEMEIIMIDGTSTWCLYPIGLWYLLSSTKKRSFSASDRPLNLIRPRRWMCHRLSNHWVPGWRAMKQSQAERHRVLKWWAS